MIRVLIVDDSLTTREYLKHIIDADPELQIAGEARNGEDALTLAATTKPDVIVMDIQMPGVNGYEATRAIMEKCPRPIIIHSTLVAPEQTDNIFKAMKAGAVTVSQKPPGFGHPDSKNLVDKLLRTIKLMSEVKVVRLHKQKHKETKSPAEPLKMSPASRPTPGIIAIGASTGGPPVLQTILSRLKPDFTIPIVIVQHIAKGFLEGMVDWLSKTSRLTLKIPKTGDPVLKGHVYFAPEEDLMDLTASRIFRIYPCTHQSARRPISNLFASVAKNYKKDAVGVLLSGMGSDGAIGLWKMKEQGALTLVQDRESSVVFGMPGEAIKLNAETYILQPEEIADFLNTTEQKVRSKRF